MKKILLQTSMAILLVVAVVAFVLIFAESESFIIGLVEKIALAGTVFFSFRLIDKLHSIMRNPE